MSSINCPSCQQSYEFEPQNQGQQVECSCGESFYLIAPKSQQSSLDIERERLQLQRQQIELQKLQLIQQANIAKNSGMDPFFKNVIIICAIFGIIAIGGHTIAFFLWAVWSFWLAWDEKKRLAQVFMILMGIILLCATVGSIMR